MKALYLRFSDQAASETVLEAVLPLARDDVGVHMVEDQPLPGWHVNLVIDGEPAEALLPYRIEPPAGMRRFAGIEDWTAPPPPPPPPASPPAESPAAARARLKLAATQQRWLREQGGLTLPSRVRVLTGKADQDRITAVLVNAGIAGIETVDFKADSGWVTLSIAHVQGIAAAIAQHVQACFSAERAHHEAIDAAADEALASYDVTAGWPV